ncbi:MAG: lysozyme [Holosporales bacterium]|jgi:GH24 family phage-related lysozyme (muramidase)
MRSLTPAGIALIKRFEGFVAQPYLCPAGFLTIGYGHRVHLSERKAMQNGITPAAAEELLLRDVAAAGRAVLRLIEVPLLNSQYDALVSFTFNLGSAALQRSTLRQKINRNEHLDVPAELLKWVWAGGRKLPGLVARRAAEGARYWEQ